MSLDVGVAACLWRCCDVRSSINGDEGREKEDELTSGLLNVERFAALIDSELS